MAYKPPAKSVKAVAASKAKGSPLSGQLTVSHPTSKPLSGQSISSNHPNWYGKSSSTSYGGGLTGLKAAQPPKSKTPTRTAPAKPAAPAAPTAPPPFLTPAEQAAWTKYQGSYQDRIGNINPDALAGASPDQITQALINGGGTLGQSLAAGQSKYTTAMGNALQAHDISTDNANQVMAARGLFQSSIRDGDLNDIDATLATRNATLNTAWSSLQTRIGTAYDTSVRDFGTTAGYYAGLGVQNAQASDTGLPGPSTGTSTTSGAAAAGSTAAAAKPATVGPAGPLGKPGPAWNAGATNQMSKIKPPKPPGPNSASMTFNTGANAAGMSFRPPR